MLSRQFLSWANRAPVGERAEATHALAKAYLYADLDRIEQGEMERAMTCLLDDPSPLVRRALAEALAGAADAPHHLVSSLAADQADIAALVLARSPLLTDAELIDAAAIGELPAQCAIAGRPALSAAVAGAVAEVGQIEAVLVLCRNDGANLAEVSVRRILERFGRDGGIREALGNRLDLSSCLRHELVVATAQALKDFVVSCRWIARERAHRVVGDACERAAMTLLQHDVERGDDLGQLRFAAYLRRGGHLTPALVLRALLSGHIALFEAALSELSGQSLGRVAGLVRHRNGLGFAALYRSCGLPGTLAPVFRAALDAHQRLSISAGVKGAALQRRIVADVIDRCGAAQGHAVDGLTALLRRFEAEAARDEFRASAIEGSGTGRPDLCESAPPMSGLRGVEPRLAADPELRAA